jgi:hypothetical protein
MRVGPKTKSVLFVMTSLGIALAIALGAGGCRRRLYGPPVVRADGGGASQAAASPSPLEAGRDKGKPSLAGPPAPPPAVGAEPRHGDRPLGEPFQHDGARIDRSVTTGTPGTDSERRSR